MLEVRSNSRAEKEVPWRTRKVPSTHPKAARNNWLVKIWELLLVMMANNSKCTTAKR